MTSDHPAKTYPGGLTLAQLLDLKQAALNGTLSPNDWRLAQLGITYSQVQDFLVDVEDGHIAAWQRLLRVMGHEVKNSLTPIRLTVEEMVALAQRIVLLFETELEPHFQEEELDLLPLLAASGERELVTRTLDDHEALRKWITRLATARGGDGEALSAFGIALAAHVRFEERELFEQAQGCLDLDDGRG